MEWKVVKCQDVIDIRDGTHDTPKYVNVGYPLITSKNLKNGSIDFSEVSYISAEDYIEINKRSKVDKGDILLAMIGTIGNPVIVDVDQEFSIKNVALFKLQNSPVDPRFFKYLLESSIVKKQLERETKGGTQKFVSLKVLRNLEIPLPPIASQRRIANILDKADEIIRKRKEAIALTEQLQKSIFLDMFGDPVINPKGWEKVKLAKISNIQGGLQVTKKRESNPIEVPYLRVANAYRDSLNLNQIKTIFVTQQELNKTSLKKGDILIVEGHGNKTEIGRSCVWDDSISNCVHQNHLIRVRVDDNIAESIYVSNFLNSIGGRSQLIKLGKTTSGLNTINTSNVKGIEILLPPIKIQKKYITIQETIFQYIQKLNQQQKESENLFNSLLQRAFKGEL
jgi:type I restriction enzyme S subunit